MFRDMRSIDAAAEAALSTATADYLTRAIPGGEYLAWVAEDPKHTVIGGAGAQLRPLVPRPHPDGKGVELGPEAIVLSVYVEREWRRKGVGELLMRELLDVLKQRNIRRVVLHASDDGRRIYERLGFQQTNEMRLDIPWR